MKLFGRTPNVDKVEIVISNHTMLRVLVMVVVLLLSLAFLRSAGTALLIVFMAFFLALALNAPVHWIAKHLPGKRKGSRMLATTISYLFIVGTLATFIALLVPPAIQQTRTFVENAPDLINSLQDQDNPIGTFIRDYNLGETVESLSSEVGNIAQRSSSAAISILGTVGTTIVSTIAVLAITFMMLIEGPRWLRLAERMVPDDRRPYARSLATDMYGVVKGFVNGQLALAALAAVIILPVMLILGIPYAGALAVIVFICGLIPMIGHIIGASIVTAIALFDSVVAALFILSFYILYQQIESYTIQPKVQSSTTKISPLLVLVAVVFGANVGGLLAAIIAIPIMGCLRIIVIDYLQSIGKLSESETKARAKLTPDEIPSSVAADAK